VKRNDDLTAPRHASRFGFRFDPEAFGRFAETIARTLGTARFLAFQTVIVVVWIAVNVAFAFFRFDKYPFILLNLAFSTQAAYAAPLILLAGNRASLRDRMTLEHAAEEADIEEEQNKRLLTGNTEILNQVKALEQRILELEKSILAAIEGRGGDA
jgi:uncharacterized membrane protein